MNKWFIIVMLALFSIGCSSIRKKTEFKEIAFFEINKDEIVFDKGLSDEAAQVLEKFRTTRNSSRQRRYQIPIEVNEKVKQWLVYFTRKDDERFHRFLQRGNKYRKLVQETLRENGVPEELYYLAMIESGYQPSALSHAGAKGIWQFMSYTGKHYGLIHDEFADERKDPIRATQAAATYLKDLYKDFDSWYLAMAAYNSGPSRVKRAMRIGDTDDYWELVQKKLLPPETRNYVPKFIAAAIIGRNPHRFGFTDINEESLPPIKGVLVPSPIKISDLAKVTGVSEDVIKEFNPHLLAGITLPNHSLYKIWIPADQENKVQANRVRLAQLRLTRRELAMYRPRSSSRSIASHRVRSGESLYSIARKHRTSIAALKRLNGMRGSNIYIGQVLKVKGQSRSIARSRRSQYGYHVVEAGSNLASIARQYRTSIASIKRLNGLSSSVIYVGQKVKVPNVVHYKVQRGDNLIQIAERFGISVNIIKELNSLNESLIFAGQVLKILSPKQI